MSAFQRMLGQLTSGNPSATPVAVPAARTVVLPPSAFADTWKQKPHQPTKIGLRVVGEDTLAEAMSLASDYATEMHPGDGPFREDLWIETYNSELMRAVLVQALCRPEDVEKQWFTHAPNDTIRCALTELTVRRLWDEYGRLAEQTSPLTAEATDEEIVALGELLAMPDVLTGLSTIRARRFRRAVTSLRAELLDEPEGESRWDA